jgi:hypothetical protein
MIVSIRKPIEPQKTYREKVTIMCSYQFSLKELMKDIPGGINPDQIMFEYLNDYGNDLVLVYYYREIKNKSYHKDMIEYNIQLEEYNDWIEFKKSKNKKVKNG